MQCPSCDTEVVDSAAVFCPRCGASLGADEAEATESLDLPSERKDDTARIAVPEPAPVRGGRAPWHAIRTELTSGGWIDAAAAAGVAILALLCVAAVLLLAPKLQYAGFASGADPVSIFTGIVIVALGVLRVPIHIGGITVSALPLGALAVAGLAIEWSARAAFSGREPAPPRSTLLQAGKVGVMFGVLAWLFALVFRFRGKDPVAADAFWALVLGVFWGTTFAFVGLARGARSWRAFAADTLGGLASRSRRAYESTVGAGVMLGGAIVLATAVLLLWIIGGLARGVPYGAFGLGDALAALLYLVAFLPNLLVLIVALSLGAPLFRGAQVGFGGRVIGGLQEISLFEWPGDTPFYAYLLLLVPIAACGFGGFYMRNAAKDRREGWKTVVLAALLFGATLAIVGWLGEARLGAGLIKQKGFARVAIGAGRTFFYGALWASAAGYLGWLVADRRLLERLRR